MTTDPSNLEKGKKVSHSTMHFTSTCQAKRQHMIQRAVELTNQEMEWPTGITSNHRARQSGDFLQ